MKIKNRGFALIEVLISVAILSMVLVSVISSVLTSLKLINENKNYTIAMTIAKTEMNDFILSRMRGLDIKEEPVQEYPGFYFSRITLPYEEPLAPVTLNSTEIIVKWKNMGASSSPYKIKYIYSKQ